MAIKTTTKAAQRGAQGADYEYAGGGSVCASDWWDTIFRKIMLDI